MTTEEVGPAQYVLVDGKMGGNGNHAAVYAPPSATAETAQQRKRFPLATGLLDFFPDALLEVAHVSWKATEQHHPGEPVHWDRSKSTDEPDALMRHFLDRGKRDIDGLRHSAKVAWRALAMLQKEIEAGGA